MAVIASSNLTSVKVKFDHGPDINGHNVVKTKTLTGIKSSTTNEDIMAVVNALVSLQQHSLNSTNRVDDTSLSE